MTLTSGSEPHRKEKSQIGKLVSLSSPVSSLCRRANNSSDGEQLPSESRGRPASWRARPEGTRRRRARSTTRGGDRCRGGRNMHRACGRGGEKGGSGRGRLGMDWIRPGRRPGGARDRRQGRWAIVFVLGLRAPWPWCLEPAGERRGAETRTNKGGNERRRAAGSCCRRRR